MSESKTKQFAVAAGNIISKGVSKGLKKITGFLEWLANTPKGTTKKTPRNSTKSC